MFYSLSRTALLSIVFFFLANSIAAGGQRPGIDSINMAKAAGGLALSGFAKWATDNLSEYPTVRAFSRITGVETRDVGNVLSIAGGMFALSLIANEDTADGLQKLSWRAPIAAGVAGLVCTKTFYNIARHVPVIGSSVHCSNEDCTGICTQCKLTKIVLSIGVYRAVDVGIQTLIHRYLMPQ